MKLSEENLKVEHDLKDEEIQEVKEILLKGEGKQDVEEILRDFGLKGKKLPIEDEESIKQALSS